MGSLRKIELMKEANRQGNREVFEFVQQHLALWEHEYSTPFWIKTVEEEEDDQNEVSKATLKTFQKILKTNSSIAASSGLGTNSTFFPSPEGSGSPESAGYTETVRETRSQRNYRCFDEWMISLPTPAPGPVAVATTSPKSKVVSSPTNRGLPSRTSSKSLPPRPTSSAAACGTSSDRPNSPELRDVMQALDRFYGRGTDSRPSSSVGTLAGIPGSSTRGITSFSMRASLNQLRKWKRASEYRGRGRVELEKAVLQVRLQEAMTETMQAAKSLRGGMLDDRRVEEVRRMKRFYLEALSIVLDDRESVVDIARTEALWSSMADFPRRD